jgi:sulfur carrier protein
LKIKVNGEDRATKARTLAELCDELDLSRAKIATARNGEFVPAARRAEILLTEGDTVELLSPRQGG